MIECPKCGQMKESDSHICSDCAKAIDSRITYYKQEKDWMAEAATHGIDVWLQQPGETQWEYTVWTAYRDSYPGKKPTYRDVAIQLETTYNSVRAIARRWDFAPRMQAWMAECDRITMLQRRGEVLDMNKAHVDMARKLREKLATAIEAIDPLTLRPGDINSLAKMSAEMERTARTDTIAQENMCRELVSDDINPDLKKAPTKQGDLSEVVQILLKAGALGDITQVGVRKSTQIALMDKEGNAMAMEVDDDGEE